MTTNLQEFLSLVYKHTPEPQKMFVRWGALKTPVFIPVSDLLNGAATVAEDKDMFFGPAVSHDGDMGKGGVIGTSVAWADADNVEAGHIMRSLLPPSIVVRSGGANGTTENYHLYWLYRDFVKGVEQIEEANRAIHRHLGIHGQGCWNAQRVLRVPGSKNFKPEYVLPPVCDIVYSRPELIYDWEDLRRLKAYDQNTVLNGKVKDNGTTDRSRRDASIATHLIQWGIGQDAIRAALKDISSKARERQDYIELTILRAAEFLAQNGNKIQTKKTIADELPELCNAALQGQGRLIGPEGEELGLVVSIAWDERAVLAPATSKDFSGRRSVIGWLESNGAGTRTFSGSDTKAVAVWKYLVENRKTQDYVKVEHGGRYTLPDDSGIFVFGPEQFLASKPDSENKIFWDPRIDEGTRLHFGDPKVVVDPLEIEMILHLTLQTNEPSVILPAVGWMMMCPFKPLVERVRFRFPALLLYGQPGSGKSSLIQYALLPLLGLFTEAISSKVSTFGAIGSLSRSHGWPSHFEEFRPSNQNAGDFQELLRSAYESGAVPRGRPDQSIIKHKLVAPIIVDGQALFSDDANIERTIALRLKEETIQVDTPANDAFDRLLTWREGTRGPMARDYVAWTLSKDEDYIAAKLEHAKAFFLSEVRHLRPALNASVAYAGLLVLTDYAKERGLRVSVPLGYAPFLTAIGHTSIPGLGTRTRADEIVEKITTFHDFPGMRTIYDGNEDVLWFSLTRILHILRIYDDADMLGIQLQDRVGKYLRGPERLEGDALYYGVEIGTAQGLGLNVYRPSANHAYVTMPNGTLAVTRE